MNKKDLHIKNDMCDTYIILIYIYTYMSMIMMVHDVRYDMTYIKATLADQ